jgi:formate hydrogenlyase transcriptional activator
MVTSLELHGTPGTADVNPTEPRPEHSEHIEGQLRQEREELLRIVDLIPQTIIVLTPNGKAIYANRVALEYAGLSLDEVQADDFRDRVFHREDVQRLLEGRQKSLSGTVPFENEQRALGKDGKYRWFLIRYCPLLGENGKVVRWYANWPWKQPITVCWRRNWPTALRG